jgi:single-strand DNA-binding protein
MSVNQHTILGNVGNPPEIRYTANGSAVANFSVATSEKWKDKKTGEKQEKTEWHRIVAFGQTAEYVQTYIDKGTKVFLQGQSTTRKWQDKAGQDRYTTEVNCSGIGSKLQVLAGWADNGEAKPLGQPNASETPNKAEGDFDDNIPF